LHPCQQLFYIYFAGDPTPINWIRFPFSSHLSSQYEPIKTESYKSPDRGRLIGFARQPCFLEDWDCTDPKGHSSCAMRFELIIVIGAVENKEESMSPRIEILGQHRMQANDKII